MTTWQRWYARQSSDENNEDNDVNYVHDGNGSINEDTDGANDWNNNDRKRDSVSQSM